MERFGRGDRAAAAAILADFATVAAIAAVGAVAQDLDLVVVAVDHDLTAIRHRAAVSQREQQERDRQGTSVKQEQPFSVETRPPAPDTPTSQGSGGTLQNPINRNDPSNFPPAVQFPTSRDTIQPAVPRTICRVDI